MELAIVADIGGTHTRMALANVDNPSLEQIEIHKSSDAKDQLVHLLIGLLRKHGAATIRSIVLAVAGPVDGRICHATNLDWELDADAVERELHSQGMRLKVWLINDLEAMAWGVGALSHEDMVVLQKGAPIKDGPIAVIASGTGLGEAIAIPINGGLKVLPTEGGHADFAPRTPKEDELLCFLRTLFPSHVSYERVLSGPGLRHLTMFLAERSEDEGTRSTAMSMLERGADREVVARHTFCPVALEAANLFADLLGAEAGNLALKCLPRGGLFVGGGLTLRLRRVVEERFLESFLNKGRMRDLLASIPVHLVLNEQVGLLGALRFAQFHRKIGALR